MFGTATDHWSVSCQVLQLPELAPSTLLDFGLVEPVKSERMAADVLAAASELHDLFSLLGCWLIY